ncbi:YopX family protein [Listeria monocytogenes]|uniref:YopX family protein n=1 Tax=Listeria monocytogenes TaxID=1639 RepID=UPI001E62874B|nr:YopX family protein [Listeria monocytogenes]MCD7640694.1 YopX family protein [Listeria monocytogenes]
MREIEFRAKVKRSLQLEQIKNGWIHGGIFENKIISRNTNEDSICAGFCSEVEIIQETVGQFTGLKDKNGKKIFEGDIVEVTGDEDYEFTSIVEYFGEGDYPAFDMRAPEDYYFESNTFSEILMSSSYELGVIGNIHENPELLEVATC